MAIRAQTKLCQDHERQKADKVHIFAGISEFGKLFALFFVVDILNIGAVM